MTRSAAWQKAIAAATCAALFAPAELSDATPVSAPPKPHIVYILSDNLGWGNVAYHRKLSPAGPSPEVVTPNIDRLVASGIELDRFYTYKFCSPSRSSLMTGRFAQHVNMHNLALTVPRHGIPVEMTTIASKLKSVGCELILASMLHFSSSHHCGMASKAQTPTGKGFDSYFGYFDGYNDYLHSHSGTPCPNSSDVTYVHSKADATKCTASSVVARHLRSTTDLWLNDHPAHGLNGTGYEEAMFAERVLGIIAGHDPTVPLFLYYPMHLVHSPLCVPEGYLEKFAFIADADDNRNHDRQFVAAMVNYLDDIVGNVASALEDAGLWSNTLLVWSSDNGAAVELTTGMKNSYPLRGGYYTNWDGGVRANAFVNGGLLPKHVRGTKLGGEHSYVSICDWYATFCGLAGVSVVDEAAQRAGLPPVDSLDLWPMLAGQNLTSPRKEILFTPLKGLQPPPTPDMLDDFDRPAAHWHQTASGKIPTNSSCDPWAVNGPRCDALNSHGNDLLDPMMISGRYKLMLGVVDQCWWQGPQYPNGSVTWDTHASWINCTTATKKACLFDIISDPTEHHDLGEDPRFVQIVDTMLARMEELQPFVYDPDRGKPEVEAACAKLNENGGFWSPWKDKPGPQ